jgi:hypothetical protein
METHRDKPTPPAPSASWLWSRPDSGTASVGPDDRFRPPPRSRSVVEETFHGGFLATGLGGLRDGSTSRSLSLTPTQTRIHNAFEKIHPFLDGNG